MIPSINMFNSFMWRDDDCFQGLLTLCGMHDLDGKPILLCSCNDNSVRLYDLPSWVILPMFSIFLVLILSSWFSFSLFFVRFSECILEIVFCFSRPLKAVFLVIGSLRGVKYIPREKLDQFRLVQAACSLPVTGRDKWKYGSGQPNMQRRACKMLWTKHSVT